MKLWDRVDMALGMPDVLSEDSRGIFHIASPPNYEQRSYYDIYKVGGWLEEYLRYVWANESSLPFHFWTGLAILCAAAKRNYISEYAATRVIPAHYIVLVAPSGNKKNVAADYGADLLVRALHVIEEKYAPPGPGQDAVFNPLNSCQVIQKGGSFSAIIERIQVWDHLSADLRKAALHADPKLRKELEEKRIRRSSIGAIFAPEVSTLLGKDAVDPVKVTDLLVECWDGGGKRAHYEESTQAHGLRELEGLAISFIGGMQPEIAQGKIHPRVIQQGFTARVLWIYRQRRDSDWPLAPPDDLKLREELVDYLVQLGVDRELHHINMTQEAYEWWDDWYKVQHHEARDLAGGQYLAPYMERKDKHIRKIALGLAISLGKASINLDILQHAKELLELEEGPMMEAYGMMMQTEEVANLDKLWHLLETYAAGGWVPEHHLVKYGTRHIRVYGTDKAVKDALGLLVMRGDLHMQTARAKGNNRETTFYRANGQWTTEFPMFVDPECRTLHPEWDPNQTRKK
jgi:hypothetical protein